MKSEAKQKIEFIIAWYNKVRIGMTFPKQMRLAKSWIDVSLRDDEFEMASAIKEEMASVYFKYIEYKAKKRGKLYRYKVLFKLLKRKLEKFKIFKVNFFAN